MRVWIIVYRDKGTKDDYKPVANQEAYLEDGLERAKNATRYLENMNKMYEYKILSFSEELFTEDHDQDFDEIDSESGGEYEDEPEEEPQPA
jgi:hypothetical protein